MSQRSPLLSRGGMAAPSRKCREASFERRRRGGAGQENYLWLERTTPSAPNKVPSGHFLDGAATPPFPRRGLRSPRFSLNSWSQGGLRVRVPEVVEIFQGYEKTLTPRIVPSTAPRCEMPS